MSRTFGVRSNPILSVPATSSPSREWGIGSLCVTRSVGKPISVVTRVRDWTRSRGVAWTLAFSSLVAAAAILFAFRDDLDKAHVALVFLLVVLASSAFGGRVLGVAIAIGAFLIFDWFFLPPYNTLLLRKPLHCAVLLAVI